MAERKVYGYNSFLICDIINEKTGKTYREENLELNHNIPIGALVEVKFDKWFGDGACQKVHARLWVIEHTRDCDGSPMYTLSQNRNLAVSKEFHLLEGGFVEESLKVVEVTNDLKDGYDALQWEDGEGIWDCRKAKADNEKN